MEVTAPMILGGILSGVLNGKYKKWIAQGKNQQAHDANENATLLACGIVAGATLIGVVLAVPFVIYKSSDALAIMPASLTWLANVIGILSVIFLSIWLYRTGSKAK